MAEPTHASFLPPIITFCAAAMIAVPRPSAAATPPAGTASAGGQCKVWAASFGGERSVLIRMNDGQITHFTALQVNAGREKEETTAYIAAYAKGGRSVGEFTDADQAINKAFELMHKGESIRGVVVY